MSTPVLPGADLSDVPGADLPGADFYQFESRLNGFEQRKLAEQRAFLTEHVDPFCIQWWNDAEFPSQILPDLAGLGLTTPLQQGYSPLFAGLVIAEMTRVDASVATFFMVHHDLFVESLYRFGSDSQRERYLADALALRTTGAFGLTEPEHGSDVAGGMDTTARREGDEWVLNGAKRWIGNGTFCDYLLLWAQDESDGSVRGFILDTSLPGVRRSKIEHKIALRTVQNALIELTDVRVEEADRFAGIDSFHDTKVLLQGSRMMVAWQAVGAQLGAFDIARQYVIERQQFGRPLASFQLVQAQLVKMLGNAMSSMALIAQLTMLPPAEISMDQVALAKAVTTERMRETVALGRALLGGNGIVTDYRMAKCFADAEAMYTYEGSYEINTLIVGRAITGLSAIV
ncbi:acyl-CoA dehydrogenase family protein [Acaricomes phytoseiuli]|uniref:acyl-CoA dehydrogenase family protein n=1 Tax=Acaricomes phytoseiuli TaxID=291968 RepID=UPI00036433A7|nr:acyl-CoA dehydrogenase family protein [Acaricomes phytoseiuli]MCW1249718.1 acyl-CoA dehydrogenase family protein [Acaricomes phytoseiuli]